ncbi:MAG: RHS repeat-associated core domain-containing protein [Bacteroidota bacterium]
MKTIAKNYAITKDSNNAEATKNRLLIKVLILLAYALIGSYPALSQRVIVTDPTTTVTRRFNDLDVHCSVGDDDIYCEDKAFGFIRPREAGRVSREGDRTITYTIHWDADFSGDATFTSGYDKYRALNRDCGSQNWSDSDCEFVEERDREMVEYCKAPDTLPGKVTVSNQTPQVGEQVTITWTPLNETLPAFCGSNTLTMRVRVNGQEIGSTSSGFSLNYTVTDFGYFPVTVTLSAGGGAVYGPYESFLDVLPSCANASNLSLYVGGGTVTPRPNGVELDANTTYTIRATGVANAEQVFEDNYELKLLDGDAGITLSGRQFTITQGLANYTIGVSLKAGREGLCKTFDDFKLFVGGSDVLIQQPCPIVLPDVLPDYGFGVTAGDEVLDYFAAEVRSDKQIIVKPGMILESGGELIIEFESPTFSDDPDKNRNFTVATSFNDYGEVVSQERQYLDDLGRPVQTQYRNLTDDVIFAQQTLFDAYDRGAAVTLPAPVDATTKEETTDECGDQAIIGSDAVFAYKETFVQDAANGIYDYTDFDQTIDGSREREENPLPVGTQPGTLGWYYSTANGASSNERLNEPATPITSFPYHRTQFYNDGSTETQSTHRAGDEYRAGKGHSGSSEIQVVTEDETVLRHYLDIRERELGFSRTETLTGQFSKVRQVNPDGKVSVSYVDRSEQAIISQYFGTQSAPILTSYQFYDDVGRMICTMPPNGVKQYDGTNFSAVDQMRYRYDYLGRVIEEESPDKGITRYLYRADGSLRFTQDASQEKEGSYTYTHYDRYIRPVESGEYQPGATGIAFGNAEMEAILESTEPGGGLSDEDGTRTEYLISYYDQPTLNETSFGSNGNQRFLNGAVAQVSRYTALQGLVSTSHYSYDERGRIEWIVREIPGLGTKKIEYRYDPSGQVREVAYQRGASEQYYHYYEYDEDTRLAQVYTGDTAPRYNQDEEITNSEALTLQAEYDYYLHGPLKEKAFPTVGQKQTFLYTIDGKLKAINGTTTGTGGSSSDDAAESAFGMTLDYHANDYQSSAVSPSSLAIDQPDQYSGNIKAQQWHSPIDGNEATANTNLSGKAYAYSYDDRQQLQTAQFGDVADEAFQAGPDYKVEIGGYDENGNLQALVRHGENGAKLHDLTYHYVPGTNRLDYIRQGDSIFLDYDYSEIGETVGQYTLKDTLVMDYNVAGRVTTMYRNIAKTDTLMHVTYDEGGFRLSKTTYDVSGIATWRTWYVRDDVGVLQAVYAQNLQAGSGSGSEGDPLPVEYPVYGMDRIGVYKPYYSTTFYELKDHQGNVRAMIGHQPTITYLATAESERASEEQQYFTINKQTVVATHLNHTPEETVAGANEAIRINNALDATPNPIGAGQTLSVFTGDTVQATVYVKYEDFNNTSNEVVPLLADYLSATFRETTSLEGGVNIFSAVDEPSYLGLASTGTFNDQQPRMYLNYMLFNRNFELVDYGFDQVTTAAKVPTDGTPLDKHDFEALSLEIPVSQPGFLYVYVSNENQENVTAYFDDLTVRHAFSNVTLAADYYPFGMKLPGREFEREGYRNANYQGEFAEADQESGFLAFESRMYDVRTGRWLTTDPAGQFHSPYLAMGNVPMMYVDPDGELAWFVPVIIGAVLNVGSQAVQGNINNFWDALGYAAIGGASGLAGFGAGQALSKAVGTLGFIGGSLTGAAGGFAGGFVSGSGNAWANGSSFKKGFNAGLTSGGYGALTGGVVGGISGGIQSVKHGGNFWSGKGATFAHNVSTGSPESVEVGEGLEYSNEYAQEFSDNNFGKVKGLNELHADNSLHELSKYKVEGDIFVSSVDGRKANAITTYLGTGKGSNVYLARHAFSSAEQLYLVMGHEYLHVGFYHMGFEDYDKQHASIYGWESEQSRLWNFRTRHYSNRFLRMIKRFKPYNIQNNPNWFPPMNTRPWPVVKY